MYDSAVTTGDGSTDGISNLGNEVVILSDSIVDSSTLTSIAVASTGNIHVSEVTRIQGTTDSINALYDTYTHLQGLGNESITISDNVIDSSKLITLDGNTTGIINAESLYTITGGIQELINSLYSSTQFTGLNNENITLTDITIAPTTSAPTFDISNLNTLDGYTSGLVNTNTVQTISGYLADLLTSYQSSGIINLGNETITLRDSGTVKASDLTTLATLNSSGSIDASTVSEINGTAEEIIAVYADLTITEPSNVNLTVDSGTVSVSQARSLNSFTVFDPLNNSGIVTGTITPGTTIAEMVDSSSGLTETTNAYTITVSSADAQATASDLTFLYQTTTVPVDASAVTNITGTIAGVVAVYEAGTSEIIGIGSETIITIDTTDVSVTGLNFLNDSTTGVIDASSIEELASGTISDLNTMLTAGNDPSSFSSDSFSQLSKVVLSDNVLSVIDLNGSIEQANQATNGTTTKFELSSELLLILELNLNL